LVDVHRTLNYAKEICLAQATEKSIRVVTDFRASNPRISGDLSRLQQVFWNLIQNAVKFTPPHGTVTIRTNNDSADSIAISVEDTGVGIRAEVLPKVFDAFEQGTTAVTREFGGLGLGLAICRALVDAHGGIISATSDGYGKGATFTVRLNLATEAECAQAPASADPSSSRRNNLRILLVEDHEDTRRTLQRLLVRRGHTISVAGTIREALDISSSEAFDLVVSDIGLPDGPGTDLMRSLRLTRPELTGIALSGFGLEEDVRVSIDAGFSAHLTKPINIQQLEDAIEHIAVRDAR
jgi:two-component system CheB/CheR fusion protein